ncbi:MAG: phosphoribosyl-AMP cyclohydrolase [Flavobacteriales bacterium]|jgi:hypothetical protein|nr:MAG: phosphoribosyl-AMP cyclohydrolase [Flavobacteriales bacterium]
MITIQDILDFQKEWGNSIIKISDSYKKNNDYLNDTNNLIDSLYAYDYEEVLFKPTLASDNQFRLSRTGALSYFIGGNDQFKEDEGFAIKGWTKIRWENAGYKIYSDIAVCMGNYFFSIDNSEPLKVEFTIVLKIIDGKLKLILHDSHLPFQK